MPPALQAAFQSVKEPLFSLGENRGFYVFRHKNKQYLRKNGVVPTPICQFFQIHGSIFKPDPSCDCSQTSVVCISHRVLLFRIRENTLYRFFALCINFLRALRFPYLFHQVQILLPDVRCEYFLPLFIRSALCFAGTVYTVFGCCAVSCTIASQPQGMNLIIRPVFLFTFPFSGDETHAEKIFGSGSGIGGLPERFFPLYLSADFAILEPYHRPFPPGWTPPRRFL